MHSNFCCCIALFHKLNLATRACISLNNKCSYTCLCLRLGLTDLAACFGVYIMLTHLIFWQNLKMKISHPRFLNIGDQENLKTEFPSCLEKKTDSEQSGVRASSNNLSETVFLFPKVSDECFRYALSLVIDYIW